MAEEQCPYSEQCRTRNVWRRCFQTWEENQKEAWNYKCPFRDIYENEVPEELLVAPRGINHGLETRT